MILNAWTLNDPSNLAFTIASSSALRTWWKRILSSLTVSTPSFFRYLVFQLFQLAQEHIQFLLANSEVRFTEGSKTFPQDQPALAGQPTHMLGEGMPVGFDLGTALLDRLGQFPGQPPIANGPVVPVADVRDVDELLPDRVGVAPAYFRPD